MKSGINTYDSKPCKCCRWAGKHLGVSSQTPILPQSCIILRGFHRRLAILNQSDIARKWNHWLKCTMPPQQRLIPSCRCFNKACSVWHVLCTFDLVYTSNHRIIWWLNMIKFAKNHTKNINWDLFDNTQYYNYKDIILVKIHKTLKTLNTRFVLSGRSW